MLILNTHIHLPLHIFPHFPPPTFDMNHHIAQITKHRHIIDMPLYANGGQHIDAGIDLWTQVTINQGLKGKDVPVLN
jgi:hypothetical protein